MVLIWTTSAASPSNFLSIEWLDPELLGLVGKKRGERDRALISVGSGPSWNSLRVLQEQCLVVQTHFGEGVHGLTHLFLCYLARTGLEPLPAHQGRHDCGFGRPVSLPLMQAWSGPRPARGVRAAEKPAGGEHHRHIQAGVHKVSSEFVPFIEDLSQKQTLLRWFWCPSGLSICQKWGLFSYFLSWKYRRDCAAVHACLLAIQWCQLSLIELRKQYPNKCWVSSLPLREDECAILIHMSNTCLRKQRPWSQSGYSYG